MFFLVRKSANFWGEPVRKSQIRKFARKKQCFWSRAALVCLYYFCYTYVSNQVYIYIKKSHVTLSQNCPKSQHIWMKVLKYMVRKPQITTFAEGPQI